MEAVVEKKRAGNVSEVVLKVGDISGLNDASLNMALKKAAKAADVELPSDAEVLRALYTKLRRLFRDGYHDADGFFNLAVQVSRPTVIGLS